MIPEELQYTKSHEWVKLDESFVLTGITYFAQEQLGDITFVELPQTGQALEQGQEMGVVESVKAASEFYSPVSGEVMEVNLDLENAPELINHDPYGKGWIAKIKASEPVSGLLSPQEYEELTGG